MAARSRATSTPRARRYTICLAASTTSELRLTFLKGNAGFAQSVKQRMLAGAQLNRQPLHLTEVALSGYLVIPYTESYDDGACICTV